MATLVSISNNIFFQNYVSFLEYRAPLPHEQHGDATSARIANEIAFGERERDGEICIAARARSFSRSFVQQIELCFTACFL